MGLSDWCSNLNKTYILVGILIILIIILILLNHQKANKIYNYTSNIPTQEIINASIITSTTPSATISKKEGFSASSDKPVLIMYYASWCGWCKKLKPVWSELKEKIKNNPELNKKIEIMEIQCDVSNPPEKAKKINGFPTIILEKNGKEISYDGERTIDAFIGFINAHV